MCFLDKIKTYFLLASLFSLMPMGSAVADSALSDEYEDTEFGVYLYSEASDETREEMLDLLENETPAVAVFAHAVSMGLGIDEVLEAAVRRDSEKGRDYVTAAASLLPFLGDTHRYTYGEYQLDDLEQPYKVEEVIERFFEDDKVLMPQPDWRQNQFHFLASAAELKELSKAQTEDWYFQGDMPLKNKQRPIFVSLYEDSEKVLIDGLDRVYKALEQDANAVLPVVIVYNRLIERPVDGIEDYPKTIRGIQQAYIEQSLMLTPVPEWHSQEHHIQAEMTELLDVFDIPERDDIPEEQWDMVEADVRANGINESFLIVVLSADADVASVLGGHLNWASAQYFNGFSSLDYAKYDASLDVVMNEGLIINRPVKLAVANFLGYTKVPIAFYYIDNNRVKPYKDGLRGLKNLVIANGVQPGSIGIGGLGGFTSPPPPPRELPPPSAPPPSSPPPPTPPPSTPPPPACPTPPCP